MRNIQGKKETNMRSKVWLANVVGRSVGENAGRGSMQTPKVLRALLLVILLGAIALPAWAAPFTATPPDVLGPLDGGLVTHIVASPGTSAPGAATLTFDLLGYLSVDGLNFWFDVFTLTIDGNPLFSGGFNMGGGGGNFINFIDPGVTIVSTQSFGGNGGGLTQFSVAHTLLAGLNTYEFGYGNMQGLGDEGWGLRSVTITADVSSSVPEPSSLALMSAGLLGMGLATYRRLLANARAGKGGALPPATA